MITKKYIKENYKKKIEELNFNFELEKSEKQEMNSFLKFNIQISVLELSVFKDVFN
jgi:hypothetical protein